MTIYLNTELKIPNITWLIIIQRETTSSNSLPSIPFLDALFHCGGMATSTEIVSFLFYLFSWHHFLIRIV